MLPIAKYHIVVADARAAVIVSPNNSASKHPVFSKNDTAGGSLMIIIRGYKSVKVEQMMENTVGS
jgi:D-alanine-D-alanine ligase-like ATP-grasp enzyme